MELWRDWLQAVAEQRLRHSAFRPAALVVQGCRSRRSSGSVAASARRPTAITHSGTRCQAGSAPCRASSAEKLPMAAAVTHGGMGPAPDSPRRSPASKFSCLRRKPARPTQQHDQRAAIQAPAAVGSLGICARTLASSCHRAGRRQSARAVCCWSRAQRGGFHQLLDLGSASSASGTKARATCARRIARGRGRYWATGGAHGRISLN